MTTGAEAIGTNGLRPVISIVATAIAGSLFIYSVALVPPSTLGTVAVNQFTAAIVMAQASVPENPQNTLAAQLHEREVAIAAREAQLAAQEQKARQSPDDIVALISMASSIILFVLVGANFYFDALRMRARTLRSDFKAVDLRQTT